ncbi:hypothetical protein IAT40_005004 [Kwoniella sp. CBS 6097]
MERIVSDHCETLSREIAIAYIGMRPDNDPVILSVFGTRGAAIETLKDSPGVRNQVDRYILATMETIATVWDQIDASTAQYEESLSQASITVGLDSRGTRQGGLTASATVPFQRNEEDAGIGLGIGLSASGGVRSMYPPADSIYEIPDGATFKAPAFPEQVRKRLRQGEKGRCSATAKRLANDAQIQLHSPFEDSSVDLDIYLAPCDKERHLAKFRSEWEDTDWGKVAHPARDALKKEFRTELGKRTQSRYTNGRSGIGSLDSIRAELAVDPTDIGGRPGSFWKKP